jgi:hypothetical protein
MLNHDTAKHRNSKQSELLKQLIGEWIVGIAMKSSNGKIVSGCGEMTALAVGEDGINSEMNIEVEGYEDYYQNDFWSLNPDNGEVHMFRITSEGIVHDHIGTWVDDQTIKLFWRGTFEDQELEEHVTLKWLSKEQFEVKEENKQFGQTNLTIDYVFKRKS